MSDHIVQAGTRNIWGGTEPFGLRRADRRHHVYMIGKTGAGKTTLLRNLILQDIEAGEGIGIIDPHGDLAEELLDHIPPWRTDHVVYFNPADLDFPIGLNLLHAVPRERRHLVRSGLVGAFKSIWRQSWGPRLEYVLSAAVAALLDVETATILGIPRLFVDDDYREWVVKQSKDPIVRAFWQTEFAGYEKRFRNEVVAPVQNKVGQLLMTPPLRNIVGQVRSGFDARFIMDNRRIFIANLSKGRLGTDTANLIGALLVNEFQFAALARADVSEKERRDFFLFIDEFQNFSTDTFASVLSEARKYRLPIEFTLAKRMMSSSD
jgi:type IV secretory pathway TraG/TraD family ATPase VirD4